MSNPTGANLIIRERKLLPNPVPEFVSVIGSYLKGSLWSPPLTIMWHRETFHHGRMAQPLRAPLFQNSWRWVWFFHLQYNTDTANMLIVNAHLLHSPLLSEFMHSMSQIMVVRNPECSSLTFGFVIYFNCICLFVIMELKLHYG